MDVILLEQIRGIGRLGDTVAVKPGFARNYLLPQEKAVIANAENSAYFEQRRHELEAKEAELLAKAQQRAAEVEALSLEITAKASDEGKLYGSIGTRELSHALAEKGAAIEKHEILLPNGPLRTVGDYEVEIELHSDVKAVVKVTISTVTEATS